MPNGCRLWQGYVAPNGYGDIRVAGKTRRVHRVAFEEFNGPLLPGLEIDHECHNLDASCAGGFTCLHRRCIEQTHLIQVTHRDNDLKGRSPAILKHHSGVCARGHKIKPGVQCRVCLTESQRESYRALRSAGYSPDEARSLRGGTLGRSLAGIADERMV